MIRSAQVFRVALLASFSAFGLAIAGCSSQPAAPPQTAAPQEDPANIKPFDINTTGGTKPMLLSVEEFKTQVKQRGGGISLLTVIDARPKAEYEAGHIPKAVNVDVEDWKKLALSQGGLQNKDAWSEKLGQLGLTRLTYAIVYADKPQDAARIWWTLKYLGILNVAIIDGGWKQWIAERGDVTAEVPEIKASKAPIEFQSARLAEVEELKTSHKSQDVKVVDARSQDEFGKGRIPGAVRLEWNELLNENGTFKKPEELRAIFQERGVDEKKTPVTYCESGGRSSLDAFALELAGVKNVKNYYCSWQQWSTDSAAPVEK